MAKDREKESQGPCVLVARDTERFKLLFTNSRPHIPGGKLDPLSTQTTRVLIGERLRNAAAH